MCIRDRSVTCFIQDRKFMSLCIVYLICVSELCSRHKLIPIIKDGYLMKSVFYKLHFAIHTIPSEELYFLDACVGIRLLKKGQ